MKNRQAGIILFIILACFLSRLPLLLSPEMILDGDECIVATMAKHMYRGTDFPLFFYGQNYGFSLIELLFILPFYLVMGFTTYAVKLAMLTLWATGVVFFYLALRRLQTKYDYLPLLITLLLIAAPSWAVFSMKAYGGYLTAFTLCNVVLYLLFDERYSNKPIVWLWIGILLALIFQAHILWLPGVVPFVAYRLYKNGGAKKILLMLLPLIAITVAFHFYRQGLSKFNIAARFNPKDVLWQQLARIPRFIYCNMHGRHELFNEGNPGIAGSIFAWIMTAVTLLLPVGGLVYFFRGRKKKLLFIASAVSVSFTFGYTIFTYQLQGKYLLPLTAYVLVSLFIFLAEMPFKRWLYGALILLIGIGMFCVTTFKIYHWPKTNPKDLAQVIAYLEKNQTCYAYNTFDMLGWQLIFYSDEKIVSRPHRFPGRIPTYALQADSTLNYGGNIAVIGYADSQYNNFAYPFSRVIGNIVIYLHPSKEELAQQFQFREEKK